MNELLSKLNEAQARWMADRSQKNMDEVERLQRELMNTPIQAPKLPPAPVDYSQELSALEKAVPGYREYERDRVRLAEQIARVESAAPPRPAPAPPPPREAQKLPGDLAPLSIAEVQMLLAPSDVLVTFLVGANGAFVWAVTRDAARWHAVAIGDTELGDLVFALRCGLDYTMWQDARAERCRALLGRGPGEEVVKGRRLEVLPFDAERAHEAYKLLLEPFSDMTRGKRLLIVPSGALTTLPFNVLVTERPKIAIPGRSSEYGDIAWLGVRQALLVLPAVGTLKASRQSASGTREKRRYLGVGNPLLDGNQDHPRWGNESRKRAQEARAKQRCQPQAVASLSDEKRGRRASAKAAALYRGGSADIDAVRAMEPLPESADELCEIGRQLGVPASDIILGAAATEGNLVQLSQDGRLAEYAVLHFATHGALSGEMTGSREPGLVMTPPEKGKDAQAAREDGFLTASEIAALKISANWVVLSACNTAAGAEDNAEALAGLARAFLFAGARGLLVSHWEVGSHAAVKLTTGAFGQLSRNPAASHSEALRFAMRELIAGGGIEAHPSQWAPFVVVGVAGG
jgi:CHAT domain-containing protein